MFKVAWSPIYAHPLPSNHRFPMEKYDLLPEQLIYEGTLSADNLFEPDALERQHVLRVHEEDYWSKLLDQRLSKQEIRKTGFPMSRELVARESVIMNGTLQAAQYALKYGAAMNIAGGTHHAFSNRGEGFCLLNDLAIAAAYLIDHELTTRVLIVDLDVHQGNGTAQIFNDDPRIFTFSMHGANNYPLIKEQSSRDIGLPDGIGDGAYLKILDRELSEIIDHFEPTFVFYQSGVDVLETDKLGRMALSLDGCRLRDEHVIATCKRNNIPFAACMGGGYSEKLSYIIEAHANTFRLAQEIFF